MTHMTQKEQYTMTHSPLPWKVAREGTQLYIDAGEGWIAEITDWPPEQAEATAAYLAKSANLFPKLVEALKSARWALEGGSDDDAAYDEICAALNASELAP